ncbi:outer membrane protein, cobalt-zinc-cadmium efflux system [Luteibacter sp. UNCMF331Sha3.1]|uniref:TolC family protein n=1 Tax=Luteibacter sp. UNCMF331Sha3.1 TaxID=1502760 RepID=UPI0008B2F768|nr:TolC family protein [Luteibacter sp. UNCMF331Sha3.1]SEM49656.1 outer membrane protein, cobalt-zinc-cadmium efflux system [Luteibacter sp. UNCMF331Sha3.1]
MYLRRAAPAGALCVLLAVATMGRATPFDETPLVAAPPDLRTAVRDVWQASPQRDAAEARVRAARERAKAAAQPVYNPAVQLDGENADVDRRTAGASLTLDVTGKRKARVSESDADVRAAEAALAMERRDVARDWLKSWASLALAREQTALGRRRVQLMHRFDELAAQRLAVGDVSAPERDLAGLALGEAQVQQASLEAAEAAALAALNTLAGETKAGLPALPRGLPPDVGPIDAATLADRPELVRARAEQDRAFASIAVADRQRRPDPTISLTGGRVRSGTRTDRVVGISVSLPLPVLNSGRYDVDAARAEADAAQASRQAAAWRADEQLVQATATYNAMRMAGESFRAGRAGAFDDRVALLDRLWQAGEIDTSDYLVQLRQSTDTALSGLALESQTWQAWFDYLAAAGRLTEWVDGHPKESP